MKFHRNGLYFLLGVINLTSAALLAIAIGTPRWIQADILRKATQTNSNSTQLFFNAGNKYMGLFRGCETKNYGHLFGARYRCFNALEEYRLVARADLAYLTLICCCCSLFLMISSTYVTCYNEMVRSVFDVMHTKIPLFAFTLTATLTGVAFGSFQYLYESKLKTSLLSSADLKDGFMTENKAKLDYSYWLMVTSFTLNILSLLIFAIYLARNKRTELFQGQKDKTENVVATSKKGSDGPGMMMY
eukprot:Seg4519.2 transcript_id=Seg4519.2/GoldUCD/mRNA.D3Y31 product="Acid-sensing ion channel 4-A" protein_id=Seg4519.2/GoldUCD/D3Y31